MFSCAQQNFPGGVPQFIPGTISTPTLGASPFIPYPPHPQLAAAPPQPRAVHTKEERTEEEQGARKVSGVGRRGWHAEHLHQIQFSFSRVIIVFVY